MGELINLRRVKKAAQRAAQEKTADANRLTHGTPSALRKRARADRQSAEQKIEAHKLDEPHS